MAKSEYRPPATDDTKSGLMLRLIVAIGLLVLGLVVLVWFPADFLIKTPLKIPVGVLLIVGSALGFAATYLRKRNAKAFTAVEVVQLLVVIAAVAMSFVLA